MLLLISRVSYLSLSSFVRVAVVFLVESYKTEQNKTEHRYSFNYVLLIAKFSIYCSCLHDEKLSFDSFLILLKEKLKIQKEIAFKNNAIHDYSTVDS